MSAGPNPDVIHASAVSINGRGVIIQGQSGTGKSALALQLIALGAVLIADDQVVLAGENADLRLSAPKPLQGLIEARYIGILRLDFTTKIKPALVVDLDVSTDARLPPLRHTVINSLRLPLIVGEFVPNLAFAITAWLADSHADGLIDPEQESPFNDNRRNS